MGVSLHRQIGSSMHTFPKGKKRGQPKQREVCSIKEMGRGGLTEDVRSQQRLKGYGAAGQESLWRKNIAGRKSKSPPAGKGLVCAQSRVSKKRAGEEMGEAGA